MLRKLFTVVFLAAVPLTTVVATGCASNSDPPDALTGDRTVVRNDNWRYTDDKGRYHPEWRTSPPVGYPKGHVADR